MFKKFSKSAKIGLATLAIGGSVAVIPASPVFASAVTSPIDKLETEAGKLDNVYDAIVPVAVGSAVFGIGMVLIKRVAFS